MMTSNVTDDNEPWHSLSKQFPKCTCYWKVHFKIPCYCHNIPDTLQDDLNHVWSSKEYYKNLYGCIWAFRLNGRAIWRQTMQNHNLSHSFIDSLVPLWCHMVYVNHYIKQSQKSQHCGSWWSGAYLAPRHLQQSWWRRLGRASQGCPGVIFCFVFTPTLVPVSSLGLS